MSCITDPISCVAGPIVGDGVDSIVSSAWDSICKSFADAATSVLTSFAKAFVAIPNVDLTSTGLRNVYAISLGLASFVAVLLLLGQVIRTAVTHDGSALATGIVGVGKAALAFMLTLSIASTCLLASDELTKWIVDNSLGGTQAFSDKIAKLVAWDPQTSGSLLLIFGILGILLTVVLWFEMLLRNAAIAVLIATSPISAAGMISEGTKGWWSKLVTSTVQLIILKPIVALVFALGFNLAGDSQDLETTLAGMLVLLLAALAWPSIARFFSFANIQAGGGAGLGALLGFAGGRLSAQGAGGPSGVSPEEFGSSAADRTMSSFASKGGGQVAGAVSGGGQAAGAASGASGAAAAAGPAGLIAAAGVRLAQQAVNSLAGGMDKMAGHAGMQAAPGAQPAGYVSRYGNQAPLPSTSGGGDGSATQGPTGGTPPQPPAEAPGQENQQARTEGTPELPVTGTAQPDAVGSESAAPSDPPTIEMPVVPSDVESTSGPSPAEPQDAQPPAPAANSGSTSGGSAPAGASPATSPVTPPPAPGAPPAGPSPSSTAPPPGPRPSGPDTNSPKEGGTK
ncbi:conjugal transfer protein TrbL family protein [Streptacidiphilus sp. EB129]|uniref:conjugal transfer protein TrbL family protein n=1 Tax=Streptacidiphilus sp. EB129 TaxID=3156262 RepID=UPI0035154C7C